MWYMVILLTIIINNHDFEMFYLDVHFNFQELFLYALCFLLPAKMEANRACGIGS